MNGHLVEEGYYSTKYGAKVESQYGYAQEFDAVSYDYFKALDKRDLSGWKTTCQETDEQIKRYQTMLEEFKAVVGAGTSKESAAYADDILKTINAGMAGVEAKKTLQGRRSKRPIASRSTRCGI